MFHGNPQGEIQSPRVFSHGSSDARLGFHRIVEQHVVQCCPFCYQLVFIDLSTFLLACHAIVTAMIGWQQCFVCALRSCDAAIRGNVAEVKIDSARMTGRVSPYHNQYNPKSTNAWVKVNFLSRQRI